MEYDNKNIVLNELIGLKARVIKSLDRKQRGASGTVIDETKNTLLLEGKDRTRRIVKKSSVFRFYHAAQSFDVDGREICFRPYERIEKSMRYYKRRR
jgi:ribonuclease P protein subunit POP4